MIILQLTDAILQEGIAVFLIEVKVRLSLVTEGVLPSTEELFVK
jgi:hypothetical protein